MTVPRLGASRLSVRHDVTSRLHVRAIAYHAMELARAHGLDGDSLDRLETAVSALASNIANHAGAGQIILRAVGDHGSGFIEILALDKGPGIADMTRAMRDTGLPAGSDAGGFAEIKRVAARFDIYSQADRGTAVVALVGPGAADDLMSSSDDSVGVVCVPLKGEEECGDDWAVDVAKGRLTAMLVDGLGHGSGAAIAALAAMSVFREVAGEAPEQILATMHRALRHSRGAALSVTRIDRKDRMARFCGVGNVDGRVVSSDSSRQLLPQSGIVGHLMPRLQAAEVPWQARGRLVMHSDGVSSRWRIDQYPGLLARHPTLIAGVLFRDFARARDDATVLVLRETLPTAG